MNRPPRALKYRNRFSKVAVGQTKSLHSAIFKGRIGGRNVFEVSPSDQRGQRASLLERLWRIGAAGVASLSSGKCSTLEKSMTVREKAGAERSKSSMRSASGPFPWHCFPLIGSYPTSPLGLGCRYGSKRWNCIGLGSGNLLAGLPSLRAAGIG
jgi:hypothetical protein